MASPAGFVRVVEAVGVVVEDDLWRRAWGGIVVDFGSGLGVEDVSESESSSQATSSSSVVAAEDDC